MVIRSTRKIKTTLRSLALFASAVICSSLAANSYAASVDSKHTHLPATFDDAPIFAAVLSDKLTEQCERTKCTANNLTRNKLVYLISEVPEADALVEALSSSQYEVLIADSLTSQENLAQVEPSLLSLEMTITWRGVPIDERVLSVPMVNSDELELATKQLLSDWIEMVKIEQLLDAEIIYQQLNASDYRSDLVVPETIGEFSLSQRAIFRDPMEGTLARYGHPEFPDALIDVSVYPISPFAHENTEDLRTLLPNELQSEKQHVESLVSQAGITDYKISEIEEAEITIEGETLLGYRLEIQLNTDIDPIFSTQYLFRQGDKFIKLSGNFPDQLLQSLVPATLASIQVPPESAFMKSLRGRG